MSKTKYLYSVKKFHNGAELHRFVIKSTGVIKRPIQMFTSIKAAKEAGEEWVNSKDTNFEESKMTVAETMVKNAMNVNEFMSVSDHLAVDIQQDWENERTIYTYKDGSKAQAQNSEFEVVSN
jgi:hypothetical protein